MTPCPIRRTAPRDESRAAAVARFAAVFALCVGSSAAPAAAAAALLTQSTDPPPPGGTDPGGAVGPGISPVLRPPSGAVIDQTRDGAPQGSQPTPAQNDAAITAAVRQEIAKDPQLSAMPVDVQTNAGRVSLTGQAPTAVLRDRIGQLASTVRGVTMVDNRVMVAP